MCITMSSLQFRKSTVAENSNRLSSYPFQFFRDLYAKKPISVKFEIPYFTVSGLTVRYLKIVEKSG